MAGGGAGEGFGVAGSYYKTGSYTYAGVPYNETNFNPGCPMDNSDPVSVRNCRLKNLQGSGYIVGISTMDLRILC